MLSLHAPPENSPDQCQTLPVTDHPVYWFAIMEDAKDRGEFEAAARAKRELERLGVHIAYKPRTVRRRFAGVR